MSEDNTFVYFEDNIYTLVSSVEDCINKSHLEKSKPYINDKDSNNNKEKIPEELSVEDNYKSDFKNLNKK